MAHVLPVNEFSGLLQDSVRAIKEAICALGKEGVRLNPETEIQIRAIVLTKDGAVRENHVVEFEDGANKIVRTQISTASESQVTDKNPGANEVSTVSEHTVTNTILAHITNRTDTKTELSSTSTVLNPQKVTNREEKKKPTSNGKRTVTETGTQMVEETEYGADETDTETEIEST